MQRCLEAEARPAPEALVGEMTDTLNRVFKPAFLGRLKIVPYYPVTGDILTRIVDLKLARLARRFEDHHGARLSFDEALAARIAERCTQTDSGAPQHRPPVDQQPDAGTRRARARLYGRGSRGRRPGDRYRRSGPIQLSPGDGRVGRRRLSGAGLRRS